MLPVLKCLAGGQEMHVKAIREIIAKQFSVSESEQEIPIPSGGSKLFANRVAWAIAYLKMSALIDSAKRSYYKATVAGLQILAKPPAAISIRWLKENTDFEEKKESWPSSQQTSQEQPIEVEPRTPDELLDAGFEQIREELKHELLDMVKNSSPSFFEKLVLDLLLRMGYGADGENSGIVTGKSGDGGIDGLIKEDKLGLERIYIQAKKWENQVPGPEIQKFAGALQGRRAKKGVFITTSTFSKPAHDYVSSIDARIVLIDGQTLTDLMIAYDIGVSLKKNYAVKRIDSDYFTDE